MPYWKGCMLIAEQVGMQCVLVDSWQKNTIITTSALMTSMFELEILTDSVETSSSKFGLGALRPKNTIRFRLCRRHGVL